ncbi:GAP family protein [Streptomyces botrytidirepellens]|uniref:GAP family protein n=1 Tax=Streptomyces botrytidirepellens TaxID=2486417 RepID=A0A3M8XE01_9ACTN|nr:GAP family protein [Streptomyces botrytidirepellens]RNG38683.1 GAP family protein [Streptomyces botrytidirepellens]
MDLQILPLAVTMMAGPQIVAAVILVTTARPVRVSSAFLLGVAVATAVGVAVTRGIFALLGQAVSPGQPSDRGSAAIIVQLVLVGLLVLAAVKNLVRRESVEPPKWLGSLMDAGPLRALRTGLLVILLMPSDIMVMLTVGAHLEQHRAGLAEALPFIGATVLIAALPLLLYLVFRRRARRAMPRLREWLNTHSWVINVAACLLFIVLILTP